MQMILAGDATTYSEISYKQFIYNCNLLPCERQYTVPVNSMDDIQLYVYFGAVKPTTMDFAMVGRCNGNMNVITSLITSNYIIAQLPDGTWYGVFKCFNNIGDLSCFLITAAFTIGAGEVRYFTEDYCVNDCDDLMEIRACYPQNATTLGFDANGIYYGLPNGDLSQALGNTAIRYFHIYNVRQGWLIKTSQKVTFKTNLLRNFRSVLEQITEFRCELVPEWYSEYILAVLARGYVFINNRFWLLDQTNFELNDEDARLWKPWAQMKDTTKLFFGCDASVCAVCCCIPTDVSVEVDLICCTPTEVSATNENRDPYISGTVDYSSDGGGEEACAVLHFVFDFPTYAGTQLSIGYTKYDAGTSGSVSDYGCDIVPHPVNPCARVDAFIIDVPEGITELSIGAITCIPNEDGGAPFLYVPIGEITILYIQASLPAGKIADFTLITPGLTLINS